MPITPMIPGAGLIGWQILQTTLKSQQKAFNSSADVARDAQYFKENIGKISSGDELVEDRRLLSVALAAFGLSDQIDSTYLLKRVLKEGAKEDTSLARRLSDGRYVALASAFDFQKTVEYPFQKEGFSDDILEAYDKKVRGDLERLLEQPEYRDNALASVTLESTVISALDITKENFEAKIASVNSVDDLISDPDLLKVALGAFGAEDRINSRNLLKRVFTEGTQDSNGLANVLNDRSLISMAKAFGFDAKPKIAIQADNFADNIIDNYQRQMFEDAIYEVDSTIGTAISFQNAAPALAGMDSSDNTKWFNVLGDSMMRNVFETALGLPSGFSQIDIDKQLEVLKEKAQNRFGIKKFTELEDTAIVNRVIYSYLLQSQASTIGGSGSQQIALTLLSSLNSNTN
ncbi:DUF1217 domain-containing protein [Sagittula sp. S175]|uniref:DUF1217 domain-containing protein n=1 Tax=Sagittula sp. S175 TaxID=3415129 RepID=UPI003C7AE6AB